MANRNVKVGETTATLLRAYFDVRLLDGTSLALSETGGQPEYNINGLSWNPSGIGTLVAVSYGRYYADLSPNIITTPGDVILTRYKSGVTQETPGDTFLVVAVDNTLPADDRSVAYYGSVSGGDRYFGNSLRGRSWKRKSADDRRRALIDATRLIEKLNFAGDKADDLQVLQFPRGNSYTDPIGQSTTTTSDVNVPQDIEFATYLVADKFLDGYDPDIEADILATQSSKYQQASTMYNREYIPEHMRAGIPSASAWSLLRPYVRDPQEVTFGRL